jgi:organic hydroperoxide reductase OsmC/OhrA
MNTDIQTIGRSFTNFMPTHLHTYKSTVQWTGNTGSGTASYQSYERDYIVFTENKMDIPGSSDPAFRGNPGRHNPEDLLLASLASCHLLWYLHLCAQAGVTVLDYTDRATGTMQENADGSGCFVEVTLNPTVTVADQSMIEKANELHKKAGDYCFIANSVNFPVRYHPRIFSADQQI